jgi:hypothetical protein
MSYYIFCSRAVISTTGTVVFKISNRYVEVCDQDPEKNSSGANVLYINSK